MALRNIVKEGDEILRKECRIIDPVTDRTRTMLDDMLETMRESAGVGIAAPQVGVMRRAFIIEPEPGEVTEFINPVVLESSGSQICTEGCLSVPGRFGEVERPEYVKVKALDRNGEEFEIELSGFPAVVFSHENDHLSGVLFIDKAVNLRDESEIEKEEME